MNCVKIVCLKVSSTMFHPSCFKCGALCTLHGHPVVKPSSYRLNMNPRYRWKGKLKGVVTRISSSWIALDRSLPRSLWKRGRAMCQAVVMTTSLVGNHSCTTTWLPQFLSKDWKHMCNFVSAHWQTLWIILSICWCSTDSRVFQMALLPLQAMLCTPQWLLQGLKHLPFCFLLSEQTVCL